MSSSVIVLCPNGRRVTVKLNTNSPLLTVLEQVCQKQGYESAKCELRKGKTVLDLSLSFRFSGLTNNAKLDLVKTDTPRNLDGEVTLSIQTETGTRVEGIFNSSASLWQVITDLNLSSLIEGGTPSVIYMRQNVTGVDKLSVTTLKSMGVSSGRVSLRLVSVKACDESTESKQEIMPPSSTGNIRNKEMSGEEVAMEEIKTTPTCYHDNIEFPVLPFSIFPSDDNPNGDQSNPNNEQMDVDTPLNHMTSCDENVSVLSGALNREPLQSKADIIVRQKPKDELIYDGPCERNPVIFSLDESVSVPVAEVSDDFFETTVGDIKMMQQDLQRKVHELSDAPLLTKHSRHNHTKCSYNRTIIRIILPDHWILQGTFNTSESLKSLVVFIRDHLADSNIKFHLYTTPPKQILTSSRPTLASIGFVPAANIHLGLDNINPLLPDQTNINPLLSESSFTRYKRMSLEADVIANNERPSMTIQRTEERKMTGVKITESASTVKPHPLKNQSSSGARGKTENEQKIPKWFKTGK